MKLKKVTKTSTFNRTVHEFADVATTHGIRYALDSNAHWMDRIVWTIMVLVATSWSIYASCSIYMSWQDDPVVTTIGTASKAIADLDFPSVTLCSQGNDVESLPKMPYILPEEWSEFWNNRDGTAYEDRTMEEKNQLLTSFMTSQVPGWPPTLSLEAFLTHMTTHNPALIKTLMLWEMEDDPNLPPMDVLFNPARFDEMVTLMGNVDTAAKALFDDMDLSSEHVKKVVLSVLWFSGMPCSSLIKHCIWKGQALPCGQIFKVIPTDVGLCCSFNHVMPSDMLRNSTFAKTIEDLEKRYAEMEKLHTPVIVQNNIHRYESQHSKPINDNIDYTPKKGKQNGLTVILDMQSTSLRASTLDQDYMGVQVGMGPRDEVLNHII
jgi:hypothetical protein